MTTIRAFFLQIRALFSNFRKRAGDTLPPPSSPLWLRACLITDEKSLGETFNNYFVIVVSNPCINILDDKSGDVCNYGNHPSIITIK